MSKLANRGPHRVLRGDLAIAGQPGVVYTPGSGLGLPAVAFAHGWLAGADNYRTLLEHLASWGIVAVAPNNERGPMPSHVGLAADLRTCLDICTGVRLGAGDISVNRERLAFAGHGMGGGAAVLAAARRPVAAVAALYPAPTSPAAESVAPEVKAPGLIVAAASDIDGPDANAAKLAAAWGGDAVLRAVDKASHNGLAEGRRVLAALGAGKADKKTQKATRALLTGFLLYTLTADKTYSDFADPDATVPKTHVIDPHAPQDEEHRGRLGQVSQLLGR
ncbi:hypothetical protein FOS14_01545 [Skermania sp. ID1734]|nr:hypothetical protein FOS14_01545 [Skermania sp. ID1734]